MGELNSRIGVMYALSMGLVITFLVLIGLSSLFLARRLNRPVKSIVSRLRDNGAIMAGKGGNEFVQISAALDTFSHKLSEDAELISEYQLLRLVSGSAVSPADVFPQPLFRCVVLLPEGTAVPDTAKPEIQRRCKTRLGPSCFVLSPDKDSLLILLNFAELEEGALVKNLRDIQGDCRRETGFSFSAGIGEEAGINEVHRSFKTARIAVSRRLLSGPGSLLTYASGMDAVKDYFYPHDREKIIFNNLRLGSAGHTAAALTAFCDEIREKKNISIDNVRTAFNQLMGSLIKYLMELRLNSREIFGEEHQLYRNLAGFEFIEDIKNFFLDNFERIIAFENRNEDKKKKHITRILEYLKANEDSTFDLNTLAESLGLSYSHVRRIFAEEMGENILHYVYRQKVEEAKKLLLETDLGINEIGEKKGFYNRLSFYRFFKKYEGITPREFRELNRNRSSPSEPL
jgi:AraC-like DNA-binding protein